MLLKDNVHCKKVADLISREKTHFIKSMKKPVIKFFRSIERSSESHQQLSKILSRWKRDLINFEENREKVNLHYPLICRVIKRIERDILKNFIPVEPIQITKAEGRKKQMADPLVKSRLEDETNQSTLQFEVLKDEQRLNKIIRYLFQDTNQSEYRTILPNHGCIQCTQIFFKGQKIKKSNMLYSRIFGISHLEADEIFLKKSICSIANQGGGTLLIGTSKEERDVVVGFHLNYQEKQELYYKIQSSVRSLLPLIYSKVDFVLVHNNILDQSANPYDENERYLCRVCVLPHQRNKIHYTKIEKKGFHQVFQIFSFKESKKGGQFPIQLESHKYHDALYQKLLQNRKTISPMYVNNHYEFCNSFPCEKYSRMSYEKKMSGEYEQTPKFSVQRGEEMEEKDMDLPKIVYKHTALVVVGSNKRDHLVYKFAKELKDKKYVFHMEKPYEKSLVKGSRSVFLLNFDAKMDIMKSCIKNFNQNSALTFMPVENKLQINGGSFLNPNDKNIRYLNAKMKQKFREEYEPLIRKYEEEACIIMEFGDSYKSIFAYMILEEMNIRPYFVKNSVYKKETEKKHF